MFLDSGTTHTRFAFSHNHCQLALFTEIAIKPYVKISTETPNKKKNNQKASAATDEDSWMLGPGKNCGKSPCSGYYQVTHSHTANWITHRQVATSKRHVFLSLTILEAQRTGAMAIPWNLQPYGFTCSWWTFSFSLGRVSDGCDPFTRGHWRELSIVAPSRNLLWGCHHSGLPNALGHGGWSVGVLSNGYKPAYVAWLGL